MMYFDAVAIAVVYDKFEASPRHFRKSENSYI